MQLGKAVRCSKLTPCTQWDGVENKTQVVGYGAGALVLLWLSSTIVSAINVLPLVGALAGSSCCSSGIDSQPSVQLPKLLELVGLGYTAWFTYRYLLFKVRCRLLPPWPDWQLKAF